MIDTDTQAWRENVVGSLADIKAQLGRLASDRESEKETLIRVTTQLHAEDRRNAERLDAHVKWNDEQHGKLHDKVNSLTWKFYFGAGMVAMAQFVAPFIWQALLK